MPVSPITECLLTSLRYAASLGWEPVADVRLPSPDTCFAVRALSNQVISGRKEDQKNSLEMARCQGTNITGILQGLDHSIAEINSAKIPSAQAVSEGVARTVLCPGVSSWAPGIGENVKDLVAVMDGKPLFRKSGTLRNFPLFQFGTLGLNRVSA